MTAWIARLTAVAVMHATRSQLKKVHIYYSFMRLKYADKNTRSTTRNIKPTKNVREGIVNQLSVMIGNVYNA